MKQISTERYLTLGMALTTDKAAMEQRVRGVFARTSSSKPTKALALLLCVLLGVGCFTTACQPAEEASASPSAIPMETTVQSPSNEKSVAGGTAQNTEREDVSFLSGLTEASQLSGSFSTRVERAAVAIDAYKTLEFDADVIMPETDGYGIAKLERHVFSDAEYQAFINYLEPGADWRTDSIDGEPFSIEMASSERYFHAFTQDANKDAVIFIAKKGGRDVYYSKYDSVLPQSSYTYAEYTNGEMEDFKADWPLSCSDAQSVATRMFEALGIEGMVLVGSEKAVAYNSDPSVESGSVLRSYGWTLYFGHEFNGLDFGNMNCTLTTSGSLYDPIDYQMSMWERLSVYVDETGVAQVDWQEAMDVTETVLRNVAVISPEEIADRLTERLQRIYRNSDNTTEVTLRVTAIRLGAAAIGEFPLPETIMHANQGLLVPCWEVETEIAGYDYHPVEVFVFNAVDGGILVGKEYESWPLS